MSAIIYNVTGSDRTLQDGTLSTSVHNARDDVAALFAVRKVQALGLQGISVSVGRQTLSINSLGTIVAESISKFVVESTNEDLFKKYALASRAGGCMDGYPACGTRKRA